MRESLFILHMFGIALGVGVGFAYMFLGIAMKKYTEQEKFDLFAKIIPPLDKMGHTGFGLLLVSGFGLLTPYFKTMKTMPLLHVKLTLVVFLFALVIYMTKLGKKMIKNQDLSLIPKIEKLGAVTHIMSLIVIVLAVLNFK